MKKFTIFTTFIMLFTTCCDEPIPDNIFFCLDKETDTISPNGGSIDVIVYSNYKWVISGTSDWCTPSITSGEANEDGQKVSFTAELTYDSREAIFWFRCADEKIKLTISQKPKEIIITDENNTFTVPSEGGNVTIDYQTNVECEIIIPEEACDWLSIALVTRALEQKSATIKVAENTTYSARRAVVKVVMVGNSSVVAEYTINQEQNADKKFVAIEKYLEAQNVPGIYVDGATEYAFDRTDGQCYISPSTLTFRIANNTAKKYFEVVLSAAPVVGEKVDVESRSKGVGLSSRTTYKGMTVSKIEDNLCYLVGGADADYVGIIIAWIEE